ncbi:MAG: hypothetical protein QOD62_2329 [Actinomycetota bacterium]|nr:hypothetical protein [Actinomycetota bacterium]
MPDNPISSALGAVGAAVGNVVTDVTGAVTGAVQTAPTPVPDVVTPILERIPSFRAAPPPDTVIANLGLLAKLTGRWAGRGFNLIARPDFEGHNDIFLELNLTNEELDFRTIGSSIPNRGSGQNDIDLFGLHYLQQISDATDGGALHLEPGIWINVPSTTAPVETASITRLATIPHGNALAAEGIAFTVPAPKFAFANTVPFPVGGNVPPQGTPNGFPEYNLGAPNPFRTNPVPAGITQAMVTNPNVALAAAIAGQTITETVVLNIGTVASITEGTNPPTVHNISDGGGGVENIPFLVRNADAAQMTATFWIETVKHGNGSFLQLQYTQTVLLNFLGLSWPHVTVATLVKRF